MLIAIPDFHGKRRAGGVVIEIARKDFKTVLLLPRRGQIRTPRRPAGHFPADLIPVNGNPRRKPVDDSADGGAMGFAKMVTFNVSPNVLLMVVSCN